MSLEFLIYLAGVSDNLPTFHIGAVLFIGMIYFTLAALMIGIFVFYNDEKGEKTDIVFLIKKAANYFVIPVVILFLICLIVPKKETIYAIVAIQATKQLADSELSQKTIKIINQKLDESIEKSQSKNEGTKK